MESIYRSYPISMLESIGQVSCLLLQRNFKNHLNLIWFIYYLLVSLLICMTYNSDLNILSVRLMCATIGYFLGILSLFVSTIVQHDQKMSYQTNKKLANSFCQAQMTTQ